MSHVLVVCNSGGPDPAPVEKYKNLQFDTQQHSWKIGEGVRVLFVSNGAWPLALSSFDHKKKEIFPRSFCTASPAVLFFLLLDSSPAVAGTPSSLSLLGGNGAPCQQRCPGCNYKPEGSPVACGILHLLWTFSKNWWSKACWPHCSPPFHQNSSGVLSYNAIFHAGAPLALQQMAMQHCPLPRPASSFSHHLHLTMKQQKKREKKKKNLGSWSVAGYLLLWGSQQYEHINSNNSGISKWRSPETAAPYWHGGHRPEDNLQSQLKFQPQIPKQLRFSPAFPTGGAENVPSVQHQWNIFLALDLSCLFSTQFHQTVSALAWLLGTWCCGVKNLSCYQISPINFELWQKQKQPSNGEAGITARNAQDIHG